MQRTAKVKSDRAASSPIKLDVLFMVDQPDAEEAFLRGDFNDAPPRSLPMVRREGNGTWEKRITLAPGHYERKFVMNGEWVHDAKAQENRVNARGSLNSVVEAGKNAPGH